MGLFTHTPYLHFTSLIHYTFSESHSLRPLGLSLGSVLGDGKVVRRNHVVSDRVVIRTLERHVTSIVLKLQSIIANVQGDEAIGSLLGISTEPLGERAQGNAVVAVASLGVARATGENEVGAVELVVGHAVVVAVDHDAVVLADNVHQGRKLGVVGRRGDEPVVDLQDLPGGVGLSESLADELDLRLRGLVAFDDVVGVVHRGAFLVIVDEAVRVDDGKGRRPVGALQVVGVVGQVVLAKVPAVLHQGRDAGLEVDACFAGDDVVVTQGLVPGLAVEGLADVHVGPALIEALDTLGGEVDTAVVEVVADGNEGGAVLLEADLFDVLGGACWDNVQY